MFASTIGTPTEPRNLGRDFERVWESAGLPGVRLHDLRHTVVSLLQELGTPPHVVQAIARHAHIDVTMSIYAHTNLDARRSTPSSGGSCDDRCYTRCYMPIKV